MLVARVEAVMSVLLSCVGRHGYRSQRTLQNDGLWRAMHALLRRGPRSLRGAVVRCISPLHLPCFSPASPLHLYLLLATRTRTRTLTLLTLLSLTRCASCACFSWSSRSAPPASSRTSCCRHDPKPNPSPNQ